MTVFAMLFETISALADTPVHRKLSPVPFTEVKFSDVFWAPRLETNRTKSLPHNFKWCEQTGRVSNFAKAAGLMPGAFEGIYFNDSDVYKVLEGASYSLAQHPDPVLEKMVDDVIAKIAAAQQEDGYLNTYYTLVEPDQKWTNLPVRHELYCAGHLFEAAAAHHRATGKRTLLDVATRFADLIDRIFGPEKRYGVPGHEEIELALVKLYEVTGQRRYFDLARFFLDIRGDASKRKIAGAYCQDHMPVRQQSEIVGHAVRAMYLYAGVADVAAYTGDQGFVDAMDRLWQDVVLRKLYITAGIGARHQGEAFGEPYELPNDTAYCETCAAIGLALWSHRMNLMHADARYADVLERAYYNGILSGIGMDGEHFFYVNPLASGGTHHRQPFYPCACCPTNVVRILPSLPGYVYAQDGHSVYVNLYVAGSAEVPLGNRTVKIVQETRYPWEGEVKVTILPGETATFDLRLRIPGWCEGGKLAVNGQPVEPLQVEKGYAVVRRQWAPGDSVQLRLSMEIRRIEAHPKVEADRGRVAIQRGPIVYAFEAVDNGGPVGRIILARDPQLSAEHRPDLLGGVTVVRGLDRDRKPVVAVPYYGWDHREAGEMAVWVGQEGKSRQPVIEDPSWEGRLYRPLDPATLGD
ncbi:MAG: glycoside hydrolase family 127 protein [Pirellulales bacterium]|nr:glycoside hydrolase family 127 protein [Pirellulales bacterium]